VQCGGIEWSEKSNGVDLRRGVSEEMRDERERERERERVLSNEVVSRVQDFELAILFDVSRRLQLSKNEDAFLSTLSR